MRFRSQPFVLRLFSASVLVFICFGKGEDLDDRETVRRMMPSQVVASIEAQKYIAFVMGVATGTHGKAFVSVANELVRRGHDVAFASMFDRNFDFVKDGSFNRLIKLKSTLEYFDKTGNAPEARQRAQANFKSKKWIFGGHRGLRYRASFLRTINEFYEGEYLSMKEEFTQTRRPDLIVCDFTDVACCDFAKANNFRFVIISSMYNHQLLSDLPWFLPHTSSGQTPFSLTYWDRVEHLFLGRFYFWYHVGSALSELNAIRGRVGAIQTNDLSFSCRNKHILVYSYPGYEVLRYTSPFIHFLGPIFRKETAELDSELKSWLDDIHNRPDESVVYMAFGTMATMNADTVRSLIVGVLFETFCHKSSSFAVEAFPPANLIRKNIHLLWPTVILDPANVLPAHVLANLESYHIKLVKWVPQIEVLKHPAVKLFISHGGSESVNEACLAAKPVIVAPCFGDQIVAGLRAQERGYGATIQHDVGIENTAHESCLKSQYLLEAYSSNSSFKEHLGKMAKIVYYNSQSFKQGADIIELEMNVGSEHLYMIEDEWLFYRLYDLDIIFPGVIIFTLMVFSICQFSYLSRRTKDKLP